MSFMFLYTNYYTKAYLTPEFAIGPVWYRLFLTKKNAIEGEDYIFTCTERLWRP